MLHPPVGGQGPACLASTSHLDDISVTCGQTAVISLGHFIQMTKMSHLFLEVYIYFLLLFSVLEGVVYYYFKSKH